MIVAIFFKYSHITLITRDDSTGSSMASFPALHVMIAVLSWGSTTMVKVFACPVVGDPSGDPFLYRLSTVSGFPPAVSHNIVSSSPDNTSVGKSWS